MSRLLLIIVSVAALTIAPAGAVAKKHHSHKPPGVKGVVLNSTCPGACAEPPPPPPPYTGTLTVTVSRAGDGMVIASQAISDGHFRIGEAGCLRRQRDPAESADVPTDAHSGLPS